VKDLADTKVQSDTIRIFKEMGHIIGIPDIFMKIFAIIWMAEELISQDDLMETLKNAHVSIGKASLSNTLNTMERFFIIEVVRKPEDRKKYYKKNASLVKLFQIMLARITGAADLRIKDFLKKHGTHEIGQKMMAELNELMSFVKFIINLDYEKEIMISES
jgi:DNA-binding transcriptional regulator GbsR (MarR family)